MEYIRSIVEGYKTNKFKEDGFNLDLTYVTERIIGMSFPGSGFETIYRNSIGDVAKLLKKKHKNNYLIINLSEKSYDYSKFDNQVKTYAWEDHHSPPINLLFTICDEIHKFLAADVENVVVIHCLAGKGRTGTMIACYLMYSGRFDNSAQVLEYYKKKRFLSGGGVTQSAQIRYIKYFESVYTPYLETKKKFKPMVAVIDSIKMNGIPKFSSNGFRPVLKVYSVEQRKVIFDHKMSMQKFGKSESINMTFSPENQPVVVGDILLKFFHERSFSNSVKKAFRMAFNTSCCDFQADGTAVFKLKHHELDPNKVRDDERFPPNFSVEVFLRLIPVNTEIENPQIAGQGDYGEYETKYNEDAQRWISIYNILDGYKKPERQEATQLLFKTADKDDVDHVLKTKAPCRDLKPSQTMNSQYSDTSPDQSQDEKSVEDIE